jgi:catechol 2,3-dioxygenase-like lactoylglutathione lyase family enzyme
MSSTAVETGTLFHISLNVSSIARSIKFYRVLVGREASKCHEGYAKFDVEEPPVVLSLVPRKPGPGGSLSHLGLRMPDEAAMRGVQQRLGSAGLATQSQDGTVCGYARQNKVWVTDPDGNAWEVYVVEEDVVPESIRKSVEGAEARMEPVPESASVVWEHFITAPVPERIPHDNDTVDEVRLTGTFNAKISEEQLLQILSETIRVLRPGGKVMTHGLMADREFPLRWQRYACATRGTAPRASAVSFLASSTFPFSTSG